MDYSLINYKSLKINEEAIYSYLMMGFFKASTPFSRIEQVQPGYQYKIDTSTLEIEKEILSFNDYFKKEPINDMEEYFVLLTNLYIEV